MRVTRLHDDEVEIDEPRVRRLLGEQAPAWAGLPLRLVEPPGTDNVVVRLGDDLVVRLPRTASADQALDREQRVMPLLAPFLPSAVPVPVLLGQPQDDYPWRWSVLPWLPGRPASPGSGDAALAGQLADVVVALRGIDTAGPTGVDLHSYRGDPLALRDHDTREGLEQCAGLVDVPRARAAWDRAVEVGEHTGPPTWIHADLQPGNLLIDQNGLAAVLDWGMVAIGDPAVDCLGAWTLLDATARGAFRARVDVDDATWARGRGWALSIALVALPYYVHIDRQVTAWARYAIGQTVDDVLG